MTSLRYVSFAGHDVERNPVDVELHNAYRVLFVFFSAPRRLSEKDVLLPPPEAGTFDLLRLPHLDPATDVAAQPVHNLQFMRTWRVRLRFDLVRNGGGFIRLQYPADKKRKERTYSSARATPISPLLSFSLLFLFYFSIFYFVFSTRRVPRFERHSE